MVHLLSPNSQVPSPKSRKPILLIRKSSTWDFGTGLRTHYKSPPAPPPPKSPQPPKPPKSPPDDPPPLSPQSLEDEDPPEPPELIALPMIHGSALTTPPPNPPPPQRFRSLPPPRRCDRVKITRRMTKIIIPQQNK